MGKEDRRQNNFNIITRYLYEYKKVKFKILF